MTLLTLRPAPPIDEATDRPDDNATRHLSAGAYLDEEFCLTALREVYFQPKRVVAPSHGIDTVAVLGHCLRARRALVARDALILATLAAAAWISWLDLVVALTSAFAVHVAATGYAVGRNAVRYLRDTFRVDHGRPDHRGPTAKLGTFRRLWVENVTTQVAARVIGVGTAYAGFAALAAALDLLAGGAWLRLGSLRAVAVLIGLLFLAPMSSRAWNHWQLREFKPLDPVRRPVRNARLEQIEEQLRGNTVVYSGYQPFVGSGSVLRRWDLAQRLVRETGREHGHGPKAESLREFARPPFSAAEIAGYVRDHIRSLANDAMPERRLPSLTVHDRVFVAGTAVTDLSADLPDERVREIIRNPTAPERHYLVCQVVSWHGELVTTVYVHFAVQGRSLYLELQVTGLMPCEQRYRVVDQIGGTTTRATAVSAVRALAGVPAAVAGAPRALLRAGRDMVTIRLAGRRGGAQVRRGYDYGAAVGLRELGQSEQLRDHMQKQDVVKYGRIVERRVLAAVLDFLEQRGVDVTEYRQRSLTILNAGAVAMDGGTVHVSGDAIGSQQTTQTTGD